MYAFLYSEEWADLICSQIIARNNVKNIHECGYFCICIGKQYDKIIRDNYEEIDRITGNKLHVFSLTPPPQSFINIIESDCRYSNLDKMSKNILRRKLTKIRERGLYHPDDRAIIHEKVLLLKDLAKAGLSADKYADFIFLDIKTVSDEHSIDLVVAKQAHLDSNDKEEKYLDLFEKMGKKANEHFEKNNDVELYVKDLSLEWDIKLSLEKTFGLATYIIDFLKKLGLKKD